MADQLPDTREMALAIAENSVHGIVVMDEAGYCLYANRAWQEMTGYSAQEMQSKPVHDCVHHHYPDGRPFPLEECPIGCSLGQNQTVRNHRDLFFRKDGSPFHVSCAASPIPGENVPALMILEIRDVSEEVDVERRREDFLAMLAHELRNPMAPIAAAADLLTLGRFDVQAVKQASAVISRQVGHMTGLVDDLLDVSRVTRGLVVLDKTSVDIKLTVLEAIEQVRPLTEARGHQMIVRASPHPAMVFGDRKRLVQIIANILNNAAKYTPEEGEILLSVDVEGTTLRITVTDNGIGMTQAVTERAFDLFSQAQRTPDRAQGGLGIGLALVRSLVTLHGGHVDAHSDGPGKGSTFTIHLPCYVEHIADLTDRREPETMPVALRPLKMMVVDDNPDAARMLAMVLETMGHEVHVEHDSYTALEAARFNAPDAFLLDIGLPGMDGIELARRIRRQPENAGALMIAVTGYGQKHDLDATSEAGFDHHIVKPASAHGLAKLLHNFHKV